jgi:hypothetical protein
MRIITCLKVAVVDMGQTLTPKISGTEQDLSQTFRELLSEFHCIISVRKFMLNNVGAMC